MNNDSYLGYQFAPGNPASISTPSDPPGGGSRLTGHHMSGNQGKILAVDKIGKRPVAFGGYSDVWKAKMTLDNGATLLVALKVLRPTRSDRTRTNEIPAQRLEREVLCWKLSHHANIAPFYGVVYQSNGAPGLVAPWYENGTANVYLEGHPDVNPLQIIWQIVGGIEYLHSMNIVHGDLKGANVMIDDQGHAKLIDFGLSRLIDSEADLTTSATSSIRWCAPELLRSSDARVTKASDVYAFASTALELLTGDVPYAKVPKKVVYRTVLGGANPRSLSKPVLYNVPGSDVLWRVLERCWMEAPLRPTISQVKKGLRLVYM